MLCFIPFIHLCTLEYRHRIGCHFQHIRIMCFAKNKMCYFISSISFSAWHFFFCFNFRGLFFLSSVERERERETRPEMLLRYHILCSRYWLHKIMAKCALFMSSWWLAFNFFVLFLFLLLSGISSDLSSEITFGNNFFSDCLHIWLLFLRSDSRLVAKWLARFACTYYLNIIKCIT